jgi:hypothetical protein
MMIRPLEGNLYSDLDEERMGWFKKRKVKKSENDENSAKDNGGLKDPSKRIFMIQAGIAAAGAFLATTFGMNPMDGVQDASAQTNKPYRPETGVSLNPDYFDELPGAIRIGSEDLGLKQAWIYLHKDIYDERWNNSGYEAARKLLGLNSGHEKARVSGRIVRSDIWKFSHAGFLLARKVHAKPTEFIPEDNHSLRFYAEGVNHLYDKHNYWARKEFAKGIFSAAKLTNDDYERMRNAGVNVHYDGGKNELGNAIILAKKFEDAPLIEKELILNAGIWKKFKNVSAPTNKNEMKNYHCEEYKLKSLYWNLGFYILANYNCGNEKESLTLRNTKGYTYPKIWGKFRYNTANNQLT